MNPVENDGWTESVSGPPRRVQHVLFSNNVNEVHIEMKYIEPQSPKQNFDEPRKLRISTQDGTIDFTASGAFANWLENALVNASPSDFDVFIDAVPNTFIVDGVLFAFDTDEEVGKK